MKARYGLIRRGIRGGTFYCVDRITGQRASLVRRQREIEDELDLTKSQAPSRLEADTADAFPADTEEVEEPVDPFK